MGGERSRGRGATQGRERTGFRRIRGLATILLVWTVACAQADGDPLPRQDPAAPLEQGGGSVRAATAETTEPNDPLALSMLPEPGRPTIPGEWAPYAIERSMGATRCPDDPHDETARTGGGGLLHRPCTGLLPRHLARVLVSIPEEDIFLPAATRAALAREPRQYLAIPGQARLPDFMADIDISEGITLRSFEGKDPADTVYLVIGPFHCIDADPSAEREGEFDVGSDGCRSARKEVRLYGFDHAGRIRDVTRRHLPEPQVSSRERELMGVFKPDLDATRLTYVPVLRWTGHVWNRASESDPPGPMPAWVPESRNLGNALHFGFAVWDGAGFTIHNRVPRALWPQHFCSPVRPDSMCASAQGDDDTEADPFVVEAGASGPGESW